MSEKLKAISLLPYAITAIFIMAFLFVAGLTIMIVLF